MAHLSKLFMILSLSIRLCVPVINVKSTGRLFVSHFSYYTYSFNDTELLPPTVGAVCVSSCYNECGRILSTASCIYLVRSNYPWYMFVFFILLSSLFCCILNFHTHTHTHDVRVCYVGCPVLLFLFSVCYCVP
jgi:hypothetical protein